MSLEKSKPWYALRNEASVDSPALLVYPDRIAQNIQQMLTIAGGPDRLRPHIKTHKMAEIIKMQQEAGIEKFKCATLAEAQLLARCQARDVLVAYPLIGPGIERLVKLQKENPKTQFSCLCDNMDSLRALEKCCQVHGTEVGVFLDINVGMNRTGIAPGDEAISIYRKLHTSSSVECRGIHLYDGHLRNPVPEIREDDCNRAFASAEVFMDALKEDGMQVPAVIAGGSPTFPIHAKRKGVELSPGTTLLWDARYGGQFPEMPFIPAASLLCRLISKPAKGFICLDLGHKAVAAEMPFPRIYLPQLPENLQVGQSEEHLVIQSEQADSLEVGTVFYAIPMHICPTVIKYPKALTVDKGEITGSWKIAARDYHLQD